ncbi:MAG: S9 family peptidase [Bacteroidales bacterium]
MSKTGRIFIVLFIISHSFFSFAQQAKELTLKDIWGSRTFFPKRPAELTPLKDGLHYYLQSADSVNVFEYESGLKTGTLFTNKDLITADKKDSLSMDDFSLSADETKVLISTETDRIYRRSSKSNYFVLDLATKQIKAVSIHGKQRLADFSPDGKKVAFVRDNNLFIKDLTTDIEEQFTSDGALNSIINGATDWVYEEEFEFSKGFFWSPDGRKIAFYRFDESQVKEFSYTEWGELYPQEYRYKYPKAGEDNSRVTLWIYDLEKKTTLPVDLGKVSDYYIPRVKWTQNPAVLSFYRMNRHQNKLELMLADASNGASRVIYTEENPAYIEVNDHLTFTPDNKFFFLSSETTGYRHLYLFTIDGRLIRQITTGNWEVTDINGYDPQKRVIYFTSTETSPLDRDLCSVNLDGTKLKKISKKKGWNSAVYSSTYKYFVYSFTDANTPPVHSVNTIKNKELRVLEDNQKLLDASKEYGFSPVEFFTVPAAEGLELNAYMIKPASFDPAKKYPVFMNVYGGPGSQSVENRWGYFDFAWYQMLAQKGYISVCVDNRGTAFRGESFKKCTYKQLGKLETEDQIAAAKYLSKLPYIDGNRIGIWGWSYGGYMTALCMTKGADVFKTGIAVAPVINWRNYDNIYTERFMQTPQENPSGYDENSPVHFAKELKGNFLLVHGTADDNVHFQNSVEFADALISANKQFRQFFYPNRNHGIYGGNTRMHLYKMMTDFILEKL